MLAGTPTRLSWLVSSYSFPHQIKLWMLTLVYSLGVEFRGHAGGHLLAVQVQ